MGVISRAVAEGPASVARKKVRVSEEILHALRIEEDAGILEKLRPQQKLPMFQVHYSKRKPPFHCINISDDDDDSVVEVEMIVPSGKKVSSVVDPQNMKE